jgi:hypothetical protein
MLRSNRQGHLTGPRHAFRRMQRHHSDALVAELDADALLHAQSAAREPLQETCALDNEDIPFILCKAAGHPDCLTQGFFYNPTVFSISNKDFVCNSVRAMYTKLDAAACPAIAANRKVLQNEVVRSQCGSIALDPIRNMLTLARSFGFDFSVLSYCVVSFGMNMFGVVLDAFASMKSMVSESARNMKVYAMLFLNKLGNVMEVLWKVLFQLADYDAFRFIKEIIKIY